MTMTMYIAGEAISAGDVVAVDDATGKLVRARAPGPPKRETAEEVETKFDSSPYHTFDVLERLVGEVQCKPGWKFVLICEDTTSEWPALRMVVTCPGVDSYNPERQFTVRHYFPVPTTTYNEKSWRRWMFEQCRRLENHELGEWFRFGEERPFAPMHGPGEDPYAVHEVRSDADARTTQDGSVRKSYKEM